MKYKFLLVLLWVAVKIFANQRDTVFIQKDIHQTICNVQESYFLSHSGKKLYREYALLMRLTLNNSRNSFIPLQDELKSLTYYSELEF